MYPSCIISDVQKANSYKQVFLHLIRI